MNKIYYVPKKTNSNFRIRAIDNALPIYVQNILISEKYKNQLLEIGEGSTSREAITKTESENFKMPLLPIKKTAKNSCTNKKNRS